jgi:hypothetical protein
MGEAVAKLDFMNPEAVNESASSAKRLFIRALLFVKLVLHQDHGVAVINML